MGALALVALLALGALWWRLDALAERMIERGATARLGVETEVRGLLLQPFSGALSMRELRIANPSGYAGDFLRVESARGALDVATLLRRHELVDVREVTLSGVVLELEQTAAGANYDAIVANLGGGARPDDAPGPKLRVHDLYVRDITAHVRLADAPVLELRVPELHFHDLGGAEGAGTGQITAYVVRALLLATATRAHAVPAALAGRLLARLGLEGAADLLLDAGERGLDAAREALRGILE